MIFYLYLVYFELLYQLPEFHPQSLLIGGTPSPKKPILKKQMLNFNNCSTTKSTSDHKVSLGRACQEDLKVCHWL